MIDKIFTIDNVIPQADLEQMSALFFSSDFPVFLERTSCMVKEGEHDLHPDDHTTDCPQFAHLFVGGYKENSQFAPIAISVLREFQKKVGVTALNVERCRYNITLARPDMKGLHLMPHVDSYVENAYTAIFYLNDSDGDTVFIEDKEVVHRIKPKANTMVCFPNNIVHCAELSRETPYRGVLNFNFSLVEGESFSIKETD